MQEETSLAELRAQIDAVDDAMHDLLMKRAALVEQVGRAKSAQDDSGVKGVLRPKREIEIMRRLWNRHKGALDKEVVMRVWREIISACVNLQSPVTLAAFMPERGTGLSEIARLFRFVHARDAVLFRQSCPEGIDAGRGGRRAFAAV